MDEERIEKEDENEIADLDVPKESGEDVKGGLTVTAGDSKESYDKK